MTATKPTVVFLHGSWHNPNHFTPVRAVFEKAGYSTECPLQATYNAKPAPPVVGIEDDVKVVQALLWKLLGEGKEVIFALHSFGGVLGTEAIREEFGMKSRKEKGLPGGVLALLYICGFVLPVGSSLESAFAGLGGLPRWIKVKVRANSMIFLHVARNPEVT